MEQKHYETFLSKIHIIIGGLSENILALPLFILLVLSIVLIFLKKLYKKDTVLMLLPGLIIPIIIALVIPHHKQQVYMVPLIPTIVLIIAISVSHLNKFFRKILIVLFVIISLFQYIELSYGYKIWFCDRKIKINNNFSYKYFDKYDENIMFYNLKNRDKYIELIKHLRFTKNKKTLILAEHYEKSSLRFTNVAYICTFSRINKYNHKQFYSKFISANI